MLDLFILGLLIYKRKGGDWHRWFRRWRWSNLGTSQIWTLTLGWVVTNCELDTHHLLGNSSTDGPSILRNKLPRGKQTKDKVPFSMGRVWNLKYTLPCPAMIEMGARSRNRETNKYRWSSTKDSEYITLGPQNMVRLTSSTEHSVSLTSSLLVSELISLLVCCFVFFLLVGSLCLFQWDGQQQPQQGGHVAFRPHADGEDVPRRGGPCVVLHGPETERVRSGGGEPESVGCLKGWLMPVVRGYTLFS